MAIQFPNNPGIGSVFTDTNAGFSYEWDGTVWKSFTPAAANNIKELDDISSGFDNSTTTFNLTILSEAYQPVNAAMLQISLGGVIQEPTTDYTVSFIDATITFTTAPAAGLDFFGVVRGTAVAIDYATDGNVQTKQEFTATEGQTSFTVSGGYSAGYIDVFRNGVRLGSDDFTDTSGTAVVLTVPAQAGDIIETVKYNVASLVTTEGQFVNLNITGVSTVGVVTGATSIQSGVFYGDGSGLTGVASTDNIQTATPAKFLSDVSITGVTTVGVVTGGTSVSASHFYGDGSALTGIDATSIKDSGGNVKAQANPNGIVVTGVLTATTGSFSGNVSVGGTLTYQDVTNIDSVGIITAQQGIQVLANGLDITGFSTFKTGINVTGIVTATSFSGDGSGLTGVGVGTEDNINTSGIITATRFVGSGTSLTFRPKIIAFDPLALQQNVAVGSSIHITFDQNIYFNGSGDVVIREGSSDGTGIQTFSISSGVGTTGLSIVDTQLIIEPSSDFSFSTSIYVTLPSTGIANTEGDFFAGSSNYNFGTVNEAFSAQGGDVVFTRADPGSPTNYYKYHIFTSRTGILTTSAPSASAADLYVMMVAGGGAGGWGPNSANGGGGGGGVLTHTGPTLALSAGTFPIGIGTGGHPDASPHTGDPMRGGNTTISSPTAIIVSAIGGGGGGYNNTYTPPGTPRAGQPGGSGGGGAYPIIPSPGGTGTSGQGNNGGAAGVNGGGGGGGGGGIGGSPTPPPTQPTNVVTAGAGGAGKPVSAFSATVLSGYVPTIPPGVISTNIGPTGLYGGGGGASYTGSSPLNLGGSAGPGGGGTGAGPLGGTGSNNGGNGVNFLGGGAGAGKGPAPVAARGGDGVMMIRYETPAP